MNTCSCNYLLSLNYISIIVAAFFDTQLRKQSKLNHTRSHQLIEKELHWRQNTLSCWTVSRCSAEIVLHFNIDDLLHAHDLHCWMKSSSRKHVFPTAIGLQSALQLLAEPNVQAARSLGCKLFGHIFLGNTIYMYSIAKLCTISQNDT